MSSALTDRGSTTRWRVIRRQILTRDNGMCWICGHPGADSVDHIQPRHLGGGDNPDNLAAAHLTCNDRRGARGGGVEPVPSRQW